MAQTTSVSQRMSKPYAYRMFLYMALALITAAPLTELSLVSYLAAYAQNRLRQTLAATLGAGAVAAAAGAGMHGLIKKGRNPQGFLGTGVVSWLGGLVWLIAGCVGAGLFFCLALCLMGMTLSLGAARAMCADLGRVLSFAQGREQGDAAHALACKRMKYGLAAGQTLTVCLAVAICLHQPRFSPWLAVPALALTGAATVFALLFPLTNRQLLKLRRYAALQAEGTENKALRELLEGAIWEKRCKPYGVRMIMRLLRLFCLHRVKGMERVQLDGDVPCIFVCNHGEIYGPIITKLFLPYPFRPWVTYEMADRKIVADRMCNGIWKDVKWIPRKALWFFADRIAAPLSAWIMRSVDCIPVFHDNPHKLMQTFRETTAAMETGDNILIFPENAATSANGRYQREGVSEFFTGFTMAGQLYYNKTGKSPLFVPMYANKKKRTISLGTPTRFDPDAPANDEKERLCAYLRGEMLKLAES